VDGEDLKKMKLALLKNREIDYRRWDECVQACNRPSVYALSWYLDVVSPDWMGVVNEDYSMVMPVCWRKKMGINYLYQPAYTQFTGVYQTTVEMEVSGAIFKLLTQHFRLIEIRTLADNHFPDENIVSKGFNQFFKPDSHYDQDSKIIHPTHRKNIRRAQKAGVYIRPMDAATFIDFKLKNQGDYPEDLNVLPDLVGQLQQKSALNIWGAYNENQKLIATVLFVSFLDRAILITSATTNEAKENKAMFLLFSETIRHFSAERKIVDFAGSSIKGVYDFNKGFGAEDESVLSIRINNLPSLLKILKR
jgi:hypothetical protein